MELVGTALITLTAATASYNDHTKLVDSYSSGAGIATGLMYMSMVCVRW